MSYRSWALKAVVGMDKLAAVNLKNVKVRSPHLVAKLLNFRHRCGISSYWKSLLANLKNLKPILGDRVWYTYTLLSGVV